MDAVLVTGAAGFIGYHLASGLLERGRTVVGFDNLNRYYDVRLKEARLEELRRHETFAFRRGDLCDRSALDAVFEEFAPLTVVHLAAQTGVRYSLEHPEAYIQSNIVGFYNILEECRNHPAGRLLYASSSSVYGNQQKTPFSISDRADRPVSLYAATKRADELMAYTYSRLFGIPMAGLRFFTVYGPFGRPDMAYFQFADRIMAGEPIRVYNHGDLWRDFTYIDDITDGMLRLLEAGLEPDGDGVRHRLYNIGSRRPVHLTHFIEVLEQALGRRAEKEFLPMQPGDVYQTFADTGDLRRDAGFEPRTAIEEGLPKFAAWYLDYRSRTEGRT